MAVDCLRESAQLTKEELGLSDEEFKRRYLSNNQNWWDRFAQGQISVYERVLCSKCFGKIDSPAGLRPLRGANYDPQCFRQRVLGELHQAFGPYSHLTPNQILSFEWMLRVARVMDGGLVKIAETDTEQILFTAEPEQTESP